MKRFPIILFLFSLAILLSACGQKSTPEGQVTIKGTFTTIINGETHFTLTDDQGKSYQLLLDENILKSSAGGMAFDRRRVVVTGQMDGSAADTIRVTSIQLDGYPNPYP